MSRRTKWQLFVLHGIAFSTDEMAFLLHEKDNANRALSISVLSSRSRPQGFFRTLRKPEVKRLLDIASFAENVAIVEGKYRILLAFE